jgi:ribose 1,5-bisphosphokinase
VSRRLVYVVGPSGAGKDSVLAWLRQRLPQSPAIHWARRTITRPTRACDEPHEAVDEAQFRSLRERGAFALSWQANGLHYGVRNSELAPIDHGNWVLLNGSRAYLAPTRSRFPGLTVVHITASPDTLRQRLLGRGRESAADVESRIQRTQTLQLPHALQVQNDGALDAAGHQLLNHLQSLSGWPT